MVHLYILYLYFDLADILHSYFDLADILHSYFDLADILHLLFFHDSYEASYEKKCTEEWHKQKS